MCRHLEEGLAFHCAPALAGIKPANLISCAKADCPNFAALVEEYNQALNSRDIYFQVLSQLERSYLLLVYRRRQLSAQLERPEIAQLLSEAGYPTGCPLAAQLERLGRRLAEQKEGFPHEIGLFLGYPPEDVTGFLRHGGKNCLLCGHWKVYAHPEQARELFRRYDKCRDALCKRVALGMSISQLFQAA